MKTTKTPTKKVAPELAKIKTDSLKDSASSTTERPTSKTRNFGWLVTGMVEACQQISTEDTVQE